MPRVVEVIVLWTALLVATASFAQSVPTAPTVVSILTTAKDLAETKSKSGDRFSLRLKVVRSIQNMGLEGTFGSYVVDVFGQAKRSIPRSIQDDQNWQKNRELETAAKALFLAGDLEGAKQTLRKCRFIPHFDFCDTQDYFLQFQFLNWELEVHELPAALIRLRTSDWKRMESAMALRVARAYVVAGREAEIPDLLSELNNRFGEAAQRGILQPGAALRNLVNTGNIGMAMQIAVDRASVSERVISLIIVAEGLMNLPGSPDERLDRF